MVHQVENKVHCNFERIEISDQTYFAIRENEWFDIVQVGFPCVTYADAWYVPVCRG